MFVDHDQSRIIELMSKKQQQSKDRKRVLNRKPAFEKLKLQFKVQKFKPEQTPFTKFININLNITQKSMTSWKVRLISLVIFLVIIATVHSQQPLSTSISPDNVCTFHIADRLFSLIYLQASDPYKIDINTDEKILFNFCHSFVPKQCQSNSTAQSTAEQKDQNEDSKLLQAFAFHVKKQVAQLKNQTTNQTHYLTKYTCTPYTSNSYINYFGRDYIKHNSEPQLVLNLTTFDKSKATEFHIFCSDEDYFSQRSFKFLNNYSLLYISGESAFGCPVFQISSLWTTLEEHQIILGIILMALGFQLLFYGLLMINVTVFITGYFISFAIYGGIFTVFLGPDSSTIAVYFSLLFILLASTLTAYGLTRLINFSIFFIGAFFGLILGALVNTIFSSLFNVHSVWSLVAFQILFTIPFGLMTFKYSDEIIILSTSLTGSYLIFRPISWLLGGFPNEFILYEMFESRELSSVPWTFYLYLLLIIIHAFMGGSYQFLKLQRQDSTNTIMTNVVTENIEQPLDKIKQTVDKLIARYSSSNDGQERYRRMKQMQNQRQSFEEYVIPDTQYGQIGNIKQRNSKDKKGRNSKEDQYF